MENSENNVFLNPNLSEEFFPYIVVALQCMYVVSCFFHLTCPHVITDEPKHHLKCKNIPDSCILMHLIILMLWGII